MISTLMGRVEILEQRLHARRQGKWYQENTVLIFLSWHLADVNGGRLLSNGEFEALSGLREKWPLSPSDDARINAYFADHAAKVAAQYGIDVEMLYAALHAEEDSQEYLQIGATPNRPEGYRLEKGIEFGLSDSQVVLYWFGCRCYLAAQEN